MFTIPPVAQDAYNKMVHFGSEAGQYLASKKPKFVFVKKDEEAPFMKKSTIIAIVAFLAAVAGALAVAYFYLRRREAELDDFEDMLLYDDYYPEYAEEITPLEE